MFQKNVGTLDRDLRLGLTLLFLLIALFFDQAVVQVIAAVFAAVAFFTAATAVCPIYGVLRISTLRK
jgi:hypothetical protein